MIELEKTSQFLDTHARLIDRRRFDFLFGDGDADTVIAALAAYANADGGFGWALEPDLRSASSQPVGALRALEVLDEIGPATSPLSAGLCDWLRSASLRDGGLPVALPGAAGPGSSPHWAAADPSQSSLHITSAICGAAHRVADHDPVVAEHPWLTDATEYCLREIAALNETRGAYEFLYVLQFLDAVHDKSPDAPEELQRLRSFIPEAGTMPVEGGAEGEKLTPLDFSPVPGRPLRGLFAMELVDADLDRLVADQREDGGWDVDFTVVSPAAAVEWRGYVTVDALKALKANGRLKADPSRGLQSRQRRSS